MRALLERTGRLAAGTALGGALVGLAEALYRQANVPYAILLYASLWALVGMAAGPVARLLPGRDDRPWLTLGLCGSAGASALGLVKFIVYRDVLAEAPEAKWVSWAMAASAAGLLVLLLWRATRGWRKVMRPPTAISAAWAVPVAALLGFALLVGWSHADDPSLATTPQPSQGKGTILLVVDTLRADALGAYGAGPHRGQPATPNLDALARRGLLFLDASAQASWTRPAVASLLTSRHVSGHGTMQKTDVLPEALPTVATELAQHGVRTGAVVTNYNLEPTYGFAHGFESFQYLHPARYLGAPESASRLAAYNVYRLLRERFFAGARQPEYFYRSAHAVNAAGLRWLDSVGDDDFFLWLHYMEPHDPYFDVSGQLYARVSTPAPPVAWADPMQRAYRDDVRRLDDAVGALIAALAERGRLEHTNIVLTADHGEEFAEHGGFYHGVTLYEEQLHLPLIVAGPAVPQGVDAELVRQIDVAPTILGLHDVPAPSSWEGRDLLSSTPALGVSMAEENHEGNVLSAVRVGEDKLITANPGNPRGLPEAQVYNLGHDPREAEPLDNPALEQRLRERLESTRAAAEEGGATAGTKALDPEAEAQLRALGYIE